MGVNFAGFFIDPNVTIHFFVSSGCYIFLRSIDDPSVKPFSLLGANRANRARWN